LPSSLLANLQKALWHKEFVRLFATSFPLLGVCPWAGFLLEALKYTKMAVQNAIFPAWEKK